MGIWNNTESRSIVVFLKEVQFWIYYEVTTKWLQTEHQFIDNSVLYRCYFKQGTQAEWRTAFLLTGVISAFGGIFYLLRRKGGVQIWGTKDYFNANTDEDKSDVEEPLIEA